MLGLQVSKIRIFPPSQTGASEQGWGYKGEVATGLTLRNHRSRILRGGPSPSSARSALPRGVDGPCRADGGDGGGGGRRGPPQAPPEA